MNVNKQLALSLSLASTFGIPLMACDSDSAEDDPPSNGMNSEAGGGPVMDSDTDAAADPTAPDGGDLGQLSGCTHPQPLVDGEDTGTFTCAAGYLHRQEAKACPSRLPRPERLDPIAGSDAGAGDAGVTDECRTDADCDPQQVCTTRYNGEFEQHFLGCAPTCTTDEDCAPSELCLCGADFGICEPINDRFGRGCHTDADCSDAALCLGVAIPGQCGDRDFFEFSCEAPGDECASSDECDSPLICTVGEDGRVCLSGYTCE